MSTPLALNDDAQVPLYTAAQAEHKRLLKSIIQGDVLFVRAWLQETTDWDGQALGLLTVGAGMEALPGTFVGYGHSWSPHENDDDDGDDNNHTLEMSPLHVAITQNHVEIVDALLNDSRVNLELRSMGCHQQLQTPLEFAVCAVANSSIIQRLLQAGADVGIRNDKQQTLLMMAALDNLVQPAQILLLQHDNKSSLLINAQDAKGQTALLLATTSQSREMQKLLLQHGADVTIRNHVNKRTALHEEVSLDEPSAEIVALMISTCTTSTSTSTLRGSNVVVEARTQSGATALMLIMRSRHDGRLLEACVAVLRVLLGMGQAAVDIEDNYGETPLHCAYDTAEFLRVLMELGNVDIDHASSRRGETALHVACQVLVAAYPHTTVCRVPMLLQEFGANRHVTDAVHGRTPLHWAARSINGTALLALLQGIGQDEVLRSMTARCATHGRTALHELVWAGAPTRGPHPWILEQYLNCASSRDDRATVVNAQDDRGWTPLHWASFRGDAEAVRVLIQAGANVRAVDAKGRTSLHLACLTFINAKEWDESIDIPHQILTSQQPMSQQDWDQMRASDFGAHMTSFRGCGPPGGWFITCDVPKVLLSEGKANPSVLDHDGNLPFFLAAALLDEQPQLLDTVYMNIRAGAHVRLA